MALRMPCRKNTLQTFLEQWTDPGWLARYFDPEEADLVAAAVRDCRRNLRKTGPDSAPAGIIRLEGVLTLYILARRAGLGALRGGLPNVSEGDDNGVPGGDDVGKAQERLRKALKEFEDSAPGSAQAPASAGIADLLKPLLKETVDVLPAAMGTTGGNGASHPKALEADED
ncbi:MAG: hypothetical protein IT364_26620 [Candidatus Hydrogenedentes bacterium]|nr:hypothetical protein [Candidatus Hydrogenedentota bacterium]